LPITSKALAKLLLNRILPLVEDNSLISNHQFHFRQRHSPIEQTRRILQKINEALETKQYCSTAFLDISQAFDKYGMPTTAQLRLFLPLNCFLILKSYLHSRYFFVKIENYHAELFLVNAGVHQGSVLGPLTYLL
jgi:hypothetical protein